MRIGAVATIIGRMSDTSTVAFQKRRKTTSGVTPTSSLPSSARKRDATLHVSEQMDVAELKHVRWYFLGRVVKESIEY
jgi:hypothetical protein